MVGGIEVAARVGRRRGKVGRKVEYTGPVRMEWGRVSYRCVR